MDLDIFFRVHRSYGSNLRRFHLSSKILYNVACETNVREGAELQSKEYERWILGCYEILYETPCTVFVRFVIIFWAQENFVPINF